MLGQGRDLDLAADDPENADAGESTQDAGTHDVADHSARVVDDVAHEGREHHLGQVVGAVQHRQVRPDATVAERVVRHVVEVCLEEQRVGVKWTG